tara:strand:- start:144 stop:338 length:195 start_codon:yes stop_codon:yes gene_type:complete
MSWFKKFTKPDWWFGENSFWGALNVDQIGYGGFKIGFATKQNSELINLVVVGVIGLGIFKILNK